MLCERSRQDETADDEEERDASVAVVEGAGDPGEGRQDDEGVVAGKLALDVEQHHRDDCDASQTVNFGKPVARSGHTAKVGGPVIGSAYFNHQ